jgi:hypothetical protein
MKTKEALAKAHKILTQNGFVIEDDKITYYESISFEKGMKVRELLSDIIFINADGDEATYQLVSKSVDFKLIEVVL